MLTRYSAVVCLLATSAHPQIIFSTGPQNGTAQPATTGNEHTNQLFTRVETLREEGKNDEALRLLNQAIWFDGSCGKCFGLRSGINGNLGRYKEGLADGFMGVQLSKTPRDKAISAYNKGFNLSQLNRRSESLGAYEECIRFDPSYGSCYFGKGKDLVDDRNYDEALKALEKATELSPKHGPSWAFKAMARGGLGQSEESLNDARSAVELAPKDPRSYLARAYAYGINSMFEETLTDAARALEIDPQRPRAHLLRAQALKFLGRKEEAAREFDLELDRKAVSKVLHPEQQFDTRIYNCGDYSTDIQTPDNFNIKGFEDCKERVLKALKETMVPTLRPPAKRSVPGLPTKRPVKK